MDFNPRSREGSDIKNVKEVVIKNNFNPRSREGSDVLDDDISGTLRISIHAPAKGATRFKKAAGLINKISIHAPAKGATTSIDNYMDTIKDFNPRSREGSDIMMRSRSLKK